MNSSHEESLKNSLLVIEAQSAKTSPATHKLSTPAPNNKATTSSATTPPPTTALPSSTPTLPHVKGPTQDPHSPPMRTPPRGGGGAVGNRRPPPKEVVVLRQKVTTVPEVTPPPRMPSPPLVGMSGVLPPVTPQHRTVTDKLLEQRKSRMESTSKQQENSGIDHNVQNDVSSSKRDVSSSSSALRNLDDDEDGNEGAAYANFKKKLSLSKRAPSSVKRVYHVSNHNGAAGSGSSEIPQSPNSQYRKYLFSPEKARLCSNVTTGLPPTSSPHNHNSQSNHNKLAANSFVRPSFLSHLRVQDKFDNNNNDSNIIVAGHENLPPGHASSGPPPAMVTEEAQLMERIASDLLLDETKTVNDVNELTATTTTTTAGSPLRPIPIPKLDAAFRVAAPTVASSSSPRNPPPQLNGAEAYGYVGAGSNTDYYYNTGGSNAAATTETKGGGGPTPYQAGQLHNEYALPPTFWEPQNSARESEAPPQSNLPTYRESNVTPTEDGNDTARATDDLSTEALWRRARHLPSFRGRAIFSTSAERSIVDVNAANVDWNAHFQALLEMPASTPKESEVRAAAIDVLQKQFRDAVLPIVETIILERHSTAADKTIPLEPLGGIAGGDKYVFGNIVVKFSATPAMLQLYGSAENAAKSVANELKGLKLLSDGDVPLLHYPLAMMVRFLGNCVWACAKIPIDASTLRSGSGDGGKTVVDSMNDPPANAILTAMGANLNLKRHRVGKALVTLCGPVDMEIHCGRDGRYYALDTARLLPPDGNTDVGLPRNAHLFRQIRSELLLSNLDPLSSDALSLFGRDRKQENDEEVLRAARRIVEQSIPQLISDFDRIARQWNVRNSENIAQLLHERGINVRYLALVLDGYLRFSVNNGRRPLQPVVTMLASEMISRSFASVARKQLLELTADASASLLPYHALLVNLFNLLLMGATKNSMDFWANQLSPMLQQKFCPPLALQKALESLCNRRQMQLANISSEWFHTLVFLKSSQLLGVEWHVSPERDTAMFRQLGGNSGTDCFSLPLVLAVKPIVRQCDPNPQRVAHRLLLEGRLGEAEARYVDELRVRSSVLGETEALVPLLVSMCELYMHHGWRPLRVPDAVRQCERAVHIFQLRVDAYNNGGLDVTLSTSFWEAYASTLGLYGRLLREVRNLQPALDSVATALSILPKDSPNALPLGLVLHKCQSLTWNAMGRYREAHDSARAAVAVASSMHRGSDKRLEVREKLADAQCLAAEMAFKVGFRREAHSRSDEALTLLEVALPKTSQQRPAGTEPVAEEEFTFSSSVAAHAAVTWILVRTEALLLDARDVNLPRTLQSARHALVKAFGAQSIEVSRSMLVEAHVLKCTGKIAQAVRLCDEALVIAQSISVGPSALHFEAVVLLFLAEFSFLPTAEQYPDEALDAKMSKSFQERLSKARAITLRAQSIFSRLKEESTPYFAKSQAMLADMIRLSPGVAMVQLTDARRRAADAVHIMESLQLLFSPTFVYALNVSALVRIDAHPSSVVIPDLFMALAASDKCMVVADSDFFTQESILYCQNKNKNAPGARYRMSLSRDALLRKLMVRLQLATLVAEQDDLNAAAHMVKEILLIFRELFPGSQLWMDDALAVLPLMNEVANCLLRSSSAPPKVSEAGTQLRTTVVEEEEKRAVYIANTAAQARETMEAQAREEFRLRQERLTSQARQVGRYFAIRNFRNGFALLHPLLESAQATYPDGALPSIPHSIALHNMIIEQLQFCRSCIESLPAGSSRDLLDEKLLAAEEHAVEALRSDEVIADPATFEGWSHNDDQQQPQQLHNSAAGTVEMSQYRIGFSPSPDLQGLETTAPVI